MESDAVNIRPAVVTDVESIYTMICELADFEKLRHQVVSTTDSIAASLFGDRPHAEAIVAEYDGVIVAFALFFQNYSTFLGKPGLYLEDVYVRPTHRKKRIGKRLLVALARIAKQRNCGRFEWSVLDWNENAISFYEGLGADVLSDWRVVRLTEDGIEQLTADAL